MMCLSGQHVMQGEECNKCGATIYMVWDFLDNRMREWREEAEAKAK